MLTLGCAGASEPTLAPVPNNTSAPSVAEAEAGQQLFVSKGCSACHGQNAEGSSIAPALPGHTEQQIRQQVRSPVGIMPRYDSNQVSEAELDELVEYITELESGDGHMEPTNLGDDAMMIMHHWMALSALKADNEVEASHHLGHITELAEDEEHLRLVEQALERLNAGDFHTAEHHIEDVLAGLAEPDLSPGELHLQMALSAMAGPGSHDAEHHLEHFIGGVSGEEKEQAQAAMDSLSSGNTHEAEEMIIRMLEGMPHQHHRHN